MESVCKYVRALLSLDSATISLCPSLFPWAKFRRAKGGVKAHVLLDYDDYLPAYVPLSVAKRSDVSSTTQINPEMTYPMNTCVHNIKTSLGVLALVQKIEYTRIGRSRAETRKC